MNQELIDVLDAILGPALLGALSNIEHCFYFIINIPILKKLFHITYCGMYGDIKIKTYA